jgi:hypothetical protein
LTVPDNGHVTSVMTGSARAVVVSIDESGIPHSFVDDDGAGFVELDWQIGQVATLQRYSLVSTSEGDVAFASLGSSDSHFSVHWLAATSTEWSAPYGAPVAQTAGATAVARHDGSVLFRFSSMTNGGPMSATFTVAGDWSTPIVAPTVETPWAIERMSSDGNGRTYVAWTADEQVNVVTFDGSDWSAPVAAGAPDTGGSVLSCAAGGSRVACRGKNAAGQHFVAVSDSGGPWTWVPVDAPESENIAVEVGPTGESVVAWIEEDAAAGTYGLQAARIASGSFAATPVPGAYVGAFDGGRRVWDLSVDADSAAHFILVDGTPAYDAYRVRSVGLSGTNEWSSGEVVDQVTGSELVLLYCDIEANAGGDAVAYWGEQHMSAPFTLRAAVRR